GQWLALPEAVFRLEPASGPTEIAGRGEARPHGLGFGPGHHGHARSPLRLRVMADRGVAGVLEIAEGDVVGGTHLLKGDEVRFRGIDPGGHPLSPCCADSVDVD